MININEMCNDLSEFEGIESWTIKVHILKIEYLDRTITLFLMINESINVSYCTTCMCTWWCGRNCYSRFYKDLLKDLFRMGKNSKYIRRNQ